MRHSRRIAVCLRAQEKAELVELLSAYAVDLVCIDPDDGAALAKLSADQWDAIVVSQKPSIALSAAGEDNVRVWLDFLSGINLRSSVVVFGAIPSGVSNNHFKKLDCVPESEGYEGVVTRLRARGVLQPEVPRKLKASIKTLEPAMLRKKLEDHGALSLLCINLTKFRKIATEFGNDAFEQVQKEIRNQLLSMWGQPGNFRADDVLCKRSDDALVFYVVLSEARGRDSLPAPGALERFGERITRELLSRAWRSLGAPGKGLPASMKVIPEIGTGYATVIHNPAVDGNDQISQLIELAQSMSRSQMLRVRERQRELLMSIIKSSELIVPAYQAVLNLAAIDLAKLDPTADLNQYKDAIFAFESLIRIRSAEFDRRLFSEFTGYLEAKTLRPDVLFALAHENHLALELDQACLRHAILGSKGLPGKLMANILPRNLYQFEALRKYTKSREDVILEVSESEEIGNYDKLGEVCDSLRKMNVKIAADDFGKGFGGLDRILQMRPEIVKFDRSLIHKIDQDPARQAFLKSMVAAAKIAGSLALAEGVETVEEARVCKMVELDLVQGFLFHKPQFKEDILESLAGSDANLDTDSTKPQTRSGAA